MARRSAAQTDETVELISDSQLDDLTSRHIAHAHVDRIWSKGDVGERELVMQFFHLLHARRTSLDPDDIDTRRKDFNEQMVLVFDGEQPG